MCLQGLEFLIVSKHLAKYVVAESPASVGLMFFKFHVTSLGHMFKDLSESASSQVWWLLT